MKRRFLFTAAVLVLTAVLGGCGMGNISYAGKQLVFETTDIEGNPVRSEDLFALHEITMLNLWATWCGPCINELPYLNQVNEELAKMDGAVVGLINDGKGEADLETAGRYLDENDIAYLNIIAPENMNEVIAQSVFPMTVFVDRSGVVIGKTLLGTTSAGKMVDYYVSAAKDALGNQ